MSRLVILGLVSIGSAICAQSAQEATASRSAESVWLTDLGEATRRAAAEGKGIFFDFTGTGWCTACAAMEREVLGQPAFATAMRGRFVLMKVDRPADPDALPAAVRAQNAALERRMAVDGWPTYVLADADARPYALVRGYRSGGVAAFVELVESFDVVRAARDAAFAAASAATGALRAGALHEALTACGPAVPIAPYQTEVDEIIALDAELGRLWRARRRLDALVAGAERRVAEDRAAVVAELDALVRESEDAPWVLQKALFWRALLTRADARAARADLERAIAIDGSTELARECRMLMQGLEPPPPPAADETPEELRERLQEDYDAAWRARADRVHAAERTEAYQRAIAALDIEALRRLLGDIPPFDPTPHVAAFAAAAERFAGSEDAVPFLVWVALHAGAGPERARAVETLVREYLRSAAVEPLVVRAAYVFEDRAAARAFLARVIDESPHAVVRGWAHHARATLVESDPDAGEAERKSVAEDRARALELGRGTRLERTIRGSQRARTELAIGMPAPEIEGVDLDGVPFALSDYRGRVVVLDFWGDW